MNNSTTTMDSLWMSFDMAPNNDNSTSSVVANVVSNAINTTLRVVANNATAHLLASSSINGFNDINSTWTSSSLLSDGTSSQHASPSTLASVSAMTGSTVASILDPISILCKIQEKQRKLLDADRAKSNLQATTFGNSTAATTAIADEELYSIG